MLKFIIVQLEVYLVTVDLYFTRRLSQLNKKGSEGLIEIKKFCTKLLSARLQAQRNELNAQVRALREELERLRYRASYVGEVVKRISENKVLVHVSPEEKYIVDVEADIDMKQVP